MLTKEPDIADALNVADIERLKAVDTIVDAARMLVLGEASLARDRCSSPVKDVDPNGHKLEAFAAGFVAGMCQACVLPRDITTLRFASFLPFMRERRREHPLAAAERAFICEYHPQLSTYFDHGKEGAQRILAGENRLGLYALALMADPDCDR